MYETVLKAVFLQIILLQLSAVCFIMSQNCCESLVSQVSLMFLNMIVVLQMKIIINVSKVSPVFLVFRFVNISCICTVAVSPEIV